MLSEFEIMYRVHKKINELYETNPTLWNNFQKVEKTIDKPTEEKSTLADECAKCIACGSMDHKPDRSIVEEKTTPY